MQNERFIINQVRSIQEKRFLDSIISFVVTKYPKVSITETSKLLLSNAFRTITSPLLSSTRPPLKFVLGSSSKLGLATLPRYFSNSSPTS